MFHEGVARDHTIIGLDIGTSSIITVVAKVLEGSTRPLITAVGESKAQGVRKGVVVDIDEAIIAIRRSLEEARQISGADVARVYVSIGGSHITTLSSKGVVAVSRADGEISHDDITRAINAAQAVSMPPNREIIHLVPREFKVDGEGGIKNVVGMSGVRLEVDTLIIQGSSPHIRNLIKVIDEADLYLESLVLGSFAVSRSVLTKDQKELGVLVLDIGGGTTQMSVFEEGNLMHTRTFPLGGGHITNDIAIGLQSSIDTAEKIKLNYGVAMAEQVTKRENIDLSQISEGDSGIVSRRRVAEIIEARLLEILSLVNQELQDIGRKKLLPAGVIITGGGAKLPKLVDLVKKELGLPAQLGFPQEVEGVMDRIDDPALATAIGLVLWGFDLEKQQGHENLSLPYSLNLTVSKLRKLFRTFLP